MSAVDTARFLALALTIKTKIQLEKITMHLGLEYFSASFRPACRLRDLSLSSNTL